MVRWRCNACGKIHLSNPEQCKRCGATILQQHRGGSGSWLRTFLVGALVGGLAGLWYSGLLPVVT